MAVYAQLKSKINSLAVSANLQLKFLMNLVD